MHHPFLGRYGPAWTRRNTRWPRGFGLGYHSALKLIGLLVLSLQLRLKPHLALTWRAVESGRWGMVDILLVAVLVAALKLGMWSALRQTLLVFTLMVVASLLASATFNPHSISADETPQKPRSPHE